MEVWCNWCAHKLETLKDTAQSRGLPPIQKGLLCSGYLIVYTDGFRWDFGEHCLSSGGRVIFNDKWNEHVEEGKWSVTYWTKDFPESFKLDVINAVNSNISYGCCGGCI